jgi:ligand-binding sensor domain-containing protein
MKKLTFLFLSLMFCSLNGNSQKWSILLEGKCILSIAEDKNGTIWVATFEDGLFQITGDNIKEYDKKNGLSFPFLRSVFIDSKNRVWIGTAKTGMTADGNGICIYDGTQWKYYTKKDGLISDAIFSFFEDSKGRMWCGTASGICLLNGDKWQTIDEIKIARFTSPAFFEDKNGDVWFMYERGIFKYNDKGVTQFDETSGLGFQAALSWTRDKDGNYWFGHFRRNYSKFDGKKFETYDVGTFSVISLIADKGAYTHEPVLVFVDSKNNIWIEAMGAGGGLYEYKDGKPEKIMEKEKFTYFHQIKTISEDKSGNVWFGTVDQGACRFNGTEWTYYEKPQLPHNQVNKIFADSKNNVWIGTLKGLVKVEPK